ncbi:DEAD/DEAH box helicase [Desulfogranum mediterraneum]|uniref:DEAD/DEAH box helicase n=1 Tax=Desulfogranum mediterraneum TaxID=160661 RepID=UPI00040609B5|nr:DEAD/DEAH box helicase [Desulfogranum mediterraneum]
MSLHTLTTSQQNFPEQYSRLSPGQRQVLHCLSVFYDWVSRTNLIHCLHRLGLRDEQGKRLVTKEVNRLLEPLQAEGLVELGSRGVRCNPEIVELVGRELLAKGPFSEIAALVEQLVPIPSNWQHEQWYKSYDQGVRQVRLALLRGEDQERVASLLLAVGQQYPEEYHDDHPLERIFFTPFDRDGLMGLSTALVGDFLLPRLNSACLRLEPLDELLAFVEEYVRVNTIDDDAFQASLALCHVCRGELAKLEAQLAAWSPCCSMLSYQGWLALLKGELEQSLEYYEQGLAMLKKTTRKRKVAYSNLAGFFYGVALLQSGESEQLQKGLGYLELVKKQTNFTSYAMCGDLEQTLLFALGRRNQAQRGVHSLGLVRYHEFFSALMAYMTLCWQGEGVSKDDLRGLELLQEMAEEDGYYWFAKEATAILLANKVAPKSNQKVYHRLQERCPLPDLALAIKPREEWEHVLDALASLEHGGGEVAAGGERLVWLISIDDEYGECEIVPKLQKLGKGGKWTKGRSVALSRLSAGVNTLSFLTSQDRRVVAAIAKSHTSSWGYYSSTPSYTLRESQALPALVDHPLLFWADQPSVQVELVKGEPELHVLEGANGYQLELSPLLEEGESFGLVRESPTRLKYIPLTREYEQLCAIVGSSVEVPFAAKERVVQALSRVTRVLTVHSDIGAVAAAARSVEADARPHVHLLPYNQGLQLEVLTRPFAQGGSYFRPGSGGETVVAEIEGEQLQTRRDLQLERDNADSVNQACPSLSRMNDYGYEWLLEDPEQCLELLTELRDMGDQVVLAWPKGESLRLTPTVTADQFSLQIKRDRDWFAATGTLRVDEELVLDMQQLLALSLESNSRFVALDDGRFLALSKAFRRRVEELRAFSENHGKGVRFSPLAGLALEEFTQEIGSCTADRHWKKNLQRFQNVAEPDLPSTLQAELRDYQLQGFQWLGRLSTLGVGACLADDMGLGKTIQALAVILLRAAQGPSLVVAPTSVLMNWQDEAARFAPTLKVQLFGNGNRKELLAAAAEFDLVICSYGLMQSEAELLAAVPWQTVVLDEAQAIKNTQTKRSRAAMQLQSEFKLITTGTPIENHLGELWNLFRFINPGLLGSLERFRRTFALPIERQGDRAAAKRLKKLIQPFILRRLKSGVLQELPSRTEVTMQVEMSQEEAALYEAQRLQALDSLAVEDEQQGDGPGHLQVLAQITRLRRFCCNPQLVVPEAGLASSKLKVFSTIVRELLENNHKALVFSQFVGHLSLIREELDRLGISYQYLDGATPTRQRTLRVKAFQAGEGDLFLISLKAGGAGLNLTAADYVIHMDPWWNPAVEDQASDRAHRIGQERPVTIYRLVVKDSIEERIVALHREKRDLADNLLSGSDMSGRISTAELLALLKES